MNYNLFSHFSVNLNLNLFLVLLSEFQVYFVSNFLFEPEFIEEFITEFESGIASEILTRFESNSKIFI